MEYYSSLNTLEQELNNLKIYDADGQFERFKNGFLVDTFKTGTAVADVGVPGAPNFDFQAAMKCLTDHQFRQHYAQKTGYDVNGIMTAAVQWSKNMRVRKTFLYNHPIKIEATKELISTFDVPTITFSESVKFADELTKELFPWATSYHSKMGKYQKQKAIESFNDDRSDIKVISTARALDEGFDIQDVSMAIVCSGTSTSRQDLQRTGRAIRWAPGKTGLIVNLYIKDTQDEKWLRARQKKTVNTKRISCNWTNKWCHGNLR